MTLEKKMLAVIVINYKTPQLTVAAVESILPALEGGDAKVIVVDNHSDDDSLQFIADWIGKKHCATKVALLESPENLGFSGGNNYGIAAIDADYYLLINSDTIVRQGAIDQLMGMTKTFPDAGIFSPRLEWDDGTPQESCFYFHHPLSEIIRSSCTSVVDSLLKKFVVAIPVCEKVSKPAWTSFACVLVSKQVFVDIGLMDDSFFMYYEDAEFCFRARKAGWSVINSPEAKVVHLRGGSSNVKGNAKIRKRLPKYYYESRTKYFYKCFGWSGLLLANVCWLLGRSISLLRELLGNKEPHVCEKEWLDIWTNFFKPNRQSVMRKGLK